MATGIAYGWQVENSSGTPVSGAKIYFKIKGTSTNATTYTDSALTVPAANPVVADAAGWFATYISPTVNYDIQIKSADDSITYQSTSVSPSTTGSQPLDATLTALAGAGFESRHFLRGTGVDTVANVTLSEAQQVYYVEDYGAVGDGSTDDRVAIQAAIDAATAAGGGRVIFSQGKTYRASNSGNSLGSLNYAIALKPNVYLCGGGTIKRHGTAMNFTLIAGFGTGTFPSITQSMGLYDLTVDGNASARVDGGAGTGGNSDSLTVWLFNIVNPVCQNIISLDAASWGFRIERCSGGAFINNLKCQHGADVNADGVHFVDCRNLTGNGFEIYTEGDDGFILEANSYDCFNCTFTGISVRAPASGVTSARRGVLILRDTSISTTQRDIYNCRVEAVTNGCDYPGLVIQGGALDVYGCHFSIVSHGDQSGLEINAGDALASGTVSDNVFEVIAYNSADRGILTNIGGAGGTIEQNTLIARVVNPGDGFAGITLDGDKWQGSLSVDYDPAGTKASPQPAINLRAVQDSEFSVTAIGGTYCVRLQAGSDNNTLTLGVLTGATTADLLIDSGSTGNRFIGGRINGTTTNSGGATNQFIGVGGVADSIVFPDPVAWTPTISSASGTITTSSVPLAVYRKVDRTIFFVITITVTDNGTGAGSLRFTPPTTPQHGSNCTARNSSTGVGLIATWASSGANISIQTTAGAYPVASGQSVVCTGWYFDT